MLVRLTKGQIMAHWHEGIRPAIERAMPPTMHGLEAQLSNVLEELVVGLMDCWVAIQDDKVVGIMTTKLTGDSLTSTKSLLIFSLWGAQQARKRIWAEGVVTLRRYAKARGCQQIIAYSTEPSVIKFIEMLGGDTSQRLLMLELEKED